MADIRWTPEQMSAIQSDRDTLLVANAGTGKTTTVVGKVLWRLGLPFGVSEESGEPLTPPPDPCRLDEIAAITFTEKAAYDLKRQLRTRIEASPRGDELRWQVDRASVGTIHSFCAQLLREHALRLGIDPGFEILDEDSASVEADELIKGLILEKLEAEDPSAKALLRRMKLAGTDYTTGVVDHVRDVIRDLRWHESSYRKWLIEGSDAPDPGRFAPLDLSALRRLCGDWDDKDEEALAICADMLRLAREARERWAAHLEAENQRDFDSLVLGASELLLGPAGEAALAAIRARYRILIIDEFQDTDFTQRDIAFAIARGVARPQLFLVGDPKQSIYRFRGADISVWNAVREDFARGGEELYLSRNFRSAPEVVDFVNRAGRVSMEETGTALGAERPESRIDYADLEAGRSSHPTAGVEWITHSGGNAAQRRQAHAVRVASHILESVGTLEIRDPETDDARPLAYRDIALLYRASTGVDEYATVFKRYGIPHFVSGLAHLAQRQEILDVLNVLRLLQSERDDVRAFGYLRSPFVGLRDETIARIRLLQRRGPLLRQARRWLEAGEWPAAPDHPELTRIEREALANGLKVLADFRQLAPRLALDELIEELLERTGYRLHLLLMEGTEEVLANLQSLIHFAEDHRAHDLSTFLQVWDRSTTRDVGLPQAPLYSKEDDVVTFSTIHQAKGLEWPMVFLLGVERRLWRAPWDVYWSDPDLGPLFCLRSADRGVRANRMVEREKLESEAEEARLLYVATTRARERLTLVGPTNGGGRTYNRWLAHGKARIRDDIVVRPEPGTGEPPGLDWLDRYRVADPPGLIQPLPVPDRSWTRSASELMLKASDPEAWRRRYERGVLAKWEFAPQGRKRGTRLPPTVRGQIIHGVLERLEAEAEIARVLEETIGLLDEPELETLLEPGGVYREQLEAEIRRVVASEEWAWYTEGQPGRDYWKELTFIHLAGHRDWRFGAIDLYRRITAPVHGGQVRSLQLDERLDALIIDFKTHPVTAAQAVRVARGYQIQADVYRAAAAVAGRAAVGLHFTHPNTVVPM